MEDTVINEVKYSPGEVTQPSKLNVIEIIDYAEKAVTKEKTEAEASKLKQKRVTRYLFVAINVVLALIFIAYKALPLASYVSVSSSKRLFLFATFGSNVDVDYVDTRANVLTSSPVFPLSGFWESSSPLASFTDAELRSILYESNSECADGEHPIKPVDLSVDADHGLLASNETRYEIDLESCLTSDLGIASLEHLAERYGSDSPVVLIVHTHGTESYSEPGATSYSDTDNCRTTDISKNVVAVGAVMAAYFESVGIPALHCTEMFDAESYIDAYDKSAAAIREFTAIYPSIQYVFDIHRDSVIDSKLTKLRPVTVIDGQLTAQYMCVVGTDERAGTHTEWRTNLAFACQLQARLYEKCDSLVRKMSIRSASYNQRWAPGSLLLEIGSCGNTLDEAKACGKAVAEQIAAIILEQ